MDEQSNLRIWSSSTLFCVLDDVAAAAATAAVIVGLDTRTHRLTMNTYIGFNSWMKILHASRICIQHVYRINVCTSLFCPFAYLRSIGCSSLFFFWLLFHCLFSRFLLFRYAGFYLFWFLFAVAFYLTANDFKACWHHNENEQK